MWRGCSGHSEKKDQPGCGERAVPRFGGTRSRVPGRSPAVSRLRTVSCCRLRRRLCPRQGGFRIQPSLPPSLPPHPTREQLPIAPSERVLDLAAEKTADSALVDRSIFSRACGSRSSEDEGRHHPAGAGSGPGGSTRGPPEAGLLGLEEDRTGRAGPPAAPAPPPSRIAIKSNP